MISRTSPARPADPPLTVRARLPSPGSLTVSGNPGFNCTFTNGETKASYAICRARHRMKTTEITRKARTARAEGRMELGAAEQPPEETGAQRRWAPLPRSRSGPRRLWKWATSLTFSKRPAGRGFDSLVAGGQAARTAPGTHGRDRGHGRLARGRPRGKRLLCFASAEARSRLLPHVYRRPCSSQKPAWRVSLCL